MRQRHDHDTKTSSDVLGARTVLFTASSSASESSEVQKSAKIGQKSENREKWAANSGRPGTGELEELILTSRTAEERTQNLRLIHNILPWSNNQRLLHGDEHNKRQVSWMWSPRWSIGATLAQTPSSLGTLEHESPLMIPKHPAADRLNNHVT